MRHFRIGRAKSRHYWRRSNGSMGLWNYGNMGLVLIALVGCAASSPIRLRSTVSTGGQTLTLLAASGYKINARLTPALELPDGRVIRFASTELTPDSNYFTAPP